MNTVLYFLTVSTAWVITMQLDKPLSELKYFWVYYLLTFPVVLGGVFVIPTLMLVNHFSALRVSRSRRKIMIVSGLLIVAVPTAYFIRYLPAVLILGAGGAVYGWVFRFGPQAKAMKAQHP